MARPASSGSAAKPCAWNEIGMVATRRPPSSTATSAYVRLPVESSFCEAPTMSGGPAGPSGVVGAIGAVVVVVVVGGRGPARRPRGSAAEASAKPPQARKRRRSGFIVDGLVAQVLEEEPDLRRVAAVGREVEVLAVVGARLVDA